MWHCHVGENCQNETKILSEQVAQLTNSIFKISKKLEILEHEQTNNDNKVIEIKPKQKAKTTELESYQHVTRHKQFSKSAAELQVSWLWIWEY